MEKSIEALKGELAKIRTGRANPSILDHVVVSYYGNDTPLNQVANISVEGGRALMVTPWEKTMTPDIEKAIHTADLGLNPVPSGDGIRVPMPSLNEERRKELTKLVRDEAERARVSVRNVRRDVNAHFKTMVKDKEITEDDERRAQNDIQKLTDQYVTEIDKLVAAKESDLMEV